SSSRSSTTTGLSLHALLAQGFASLQRLSSPNSTSGATPRMLHHGTCGSPPRTRASLRAVQAARLLQAAVPISATFAAPFCIRPDPDADDVFQIIGSSFASQRTGRERLCRYGARPPFSLERLRVLPGGRIAYRIKKLGAGRGKHRVMTPLELLARLAALVP